MRFEIQGLIDDLKVGSHPSRVGRKYEDDAGKFVIPVIYDPTKRVQDSLIPIVKHADGCPEEDCDCGRVWHDGPG